MAATVKAPSLEGLVETIKTECALVAKAEASALDHAIKAGHALIRAKAQVPGSWTDWLAVNLDISYGIANKYMRLARYEAHVRATSATCIRGAVEAVAFLPESPRGRDPIPIDPAILAKVKRGEMTQAEAAAAAGVSTSTVSNRTRGISRTGQTPAPPERRAVYAARRRAATVALRKEEEARAVRKAAVKPVSEAYALVRRSLQLLDQAMGEVESTEVKAHLATATRRLHAAEDEIVRASRLS
jgi:hypothetical protein